MAQSRTALGQRVPPQYDRGVVSSLFSEQDRENTRLTFAAGTVSWNPGSINNGSSETKAVTCPGVVAGVMAHVRVFPPYSLQGLGHSGYVSADDEVTIVLENNSGGAVNLGDGTWGVVVENFVLT